MFRRRHSHGAVMGKEEWTSHQQPKPTSPTTSTTKKLTRFILDWIKLSWRDILAMAILGAASQAIYSAPLAAIRTFPITFDSSSGDIVYPEFAYPERGWIISPALSGVLSALVPIFIILVAQIRIRSFWDANNAILGVLYALILGTLFQVIIKQLIGGLRPYFLEVCAPDLSRAASHNLTHLNGVGYKQVMYSVDVCTNPDSGALKNAMTSFPSGHSTAAFAGYGFLFLWMNAKLKVWSSHQTSFYWLALLFAPVLGATLMACALTIDAAHNWYDILAGSIIGIVMAFASYRVCYAAVFDWRWNHVPLVRDRAFGYGMTDLDMDDEIWERAVFVRKNGWGRRRTPSKTRGGVLDKAARNKGHDVNGRAWHDESGTVVDGGRDRGWDNGPSDPHNTTLGSPRYPEAAVQGGHDMV